MKLCKLIFKLFAAFLAFFGVTFAVYWFNGDMKLVRVIYEKLQPHYDSLEKDRRL